MPLELAHSITTSHSRDSLARQDFVSGLRSFVLIDLADRLKTRYDSVIEPDFIAKTGQVPTDQDTIRSVMADDLLFKFYSSTRYNAQEMSWRSVIPSVQAGLAEIKAKAAAATETPLCSLRLDPDLAPPENIAGLDIHLMPGGYAGQDEIAAGAVYDNGLTVFSAGFMGKNLDDIGQSFAHYVKHRFPDFIPMRILDCGCTIGHNSLPWAQTFPAAEVHAIDVASPLVSYAHARAESLGVPMHFHQMDATTLDFADGSMDIVFSSMFLHELAVQDTKTFFSEAFRVLKPGGLLLTMELPPNQELKPYDQFYLDWDCYYNREPFYREFRDQDPVALLKAAGFSTESYFQAVIPQYTYMEPIEFAKAVRSSDTVTGDTGRLSDVVQWFGFGIWKSTP